MAMGRRDVVDGAEIDYAESLKFKASATQHFPKYSRHMPDPLSQFPDTDTNFRTAHCPLSPDWPESTHLAR